MLKEEGVLEIIGVINLESLPGHLKITVGVKLATVDLIKKGEEFSKLPEAVWINKPIFD
jgi:Lrp/AsnC family transcriptional regulator for asnA, asnC and gidA